MSSCRGGPLLVLRTEFSKKCFGLGLADLPTFPLGVRIPEFVEVRIYVFTSSFFFLLSSWRRSIFSSWCFAVFNATAPRSPFFYGTFSPAASPWPVRGQLVVFSSAA